ncbi:hypothetical protein ColLi_06619 [Colletotrichum liriopes]|uniref:Uncharacterized protein n=1 Tax=Colletotrichum liriopes TaxID=708192 RepID=A0AA37GNZ8_9PEZI|nr:hypothetical protein ColLi_06619 [Colletotrichum liriopes]
MHFTDFTKVVLYEDTDNCNPKPNSKVRWLRNTADECFTLGGDLQLTKCTHYTWNGQRLEEGDGCHGNYWPKSAGFKDIDAKGKVCYFWTEENCTGKRPEWWKMLSQHRRG